jgi:hypothetical protein
MIMHSWCIVLITEAAAADYMYQETSQTADHHNCPHLIMMSDKKGCHIANLSFILCSFFMTIYTWPNVDNQLFVRFLDKCIDKQLIYAFIKKHHKPNHDHAPSPAFMHTLIKLNG